MEDCLFCKIINGEIPSEKVYEDEYVYAFKDIDPKAPVHFLVIPKKHIRSVSHLEETDGEIVGKIFLAIKKIASEQGIDKEGYRVVTNIGENAGQSVLHLHYHVLGGRSLAWPPG
ncbi:MAG: histidine triad nucleotide-binding protein [Clostridia bacterium]|nr:histidine triad nucleotide-binding protein [Clostridia bacterium]